MKMIFKKAELVHLDFLHQGDEDNVLNDLIIRGNRMQSL